MEVDIHEVVAAAATKPFGFTPYTPGPGLGGHCIPIDPFYLTWKAREYGLKTRFIELAGEVNKAMPAWVIDKLTEALNDRCKAVRGSKILVLGVAYKKNVDDMRESPSIELLEILREKGAEVAYSDPHVPEFPVLREHVFELQSLDLTAQSIAEFDVVLLATDHDLFDYDLIREHAAVVVDTRGKYRQKFEGLVQA
jgi:UDP-N-acetyl-D-glucosamine dehydrogenase